MESSAPKPKPGPYHVRLSNGQVVEGLHLQDLSAMIQKGQLLGDEIARMGAEGVWVSIGSVPELGDLILKKAAQSRSVAKTPPAGMPTVAKMAAAAAAGAESTTRDGESKPGGTRTGFPPSLATGTRARPPDSPRPSVLPNDDKTVVASDEEGTQLATRVEAPLAEIGGGLELVGGAGVSAVSEARVPEVLPETQYALPETARQATLMMDRPKASSAAGSGPVRGGVNRLKPRGKSEKAKATIVLLALALVVHEIFFGDGGSTDKEFKEPVRPRVPEATTPADPAASSKKYAEGMKSYVEDTIAGYRQAANLFGQSASLDANNAKAYAMLASTFIHLVEVSERSENYFITVTRLIEIARAKALNLPETVIADTEYFLLMNRPDSAQGRIVDYTRAYAKFDPVMFHYLAEVFLERGDAQSAARYSAQYPDQRAYSPVLFHLRGRIAEALSDTSTAEAQYEKAIALNKKHAKSHLKLAELRCGSARIKDCDKHVRFLLKNSELLAPRDLARALYLEGKVHESYQRWEDALGSMEAALALDHRNVDYRYESYSLQAKLGESVKKYQATARMYFFLSEGEKLAKAGDYSEALVQFLQARQAYSKSPIPLVKAGDMFVRNGEWSNAQLNFQKAHELAPDNPEIAGKYINVLIQAYEWELAEATMRKFRGAEGVKQGFLDKAAADLYFRQGRIAEAVAFYRKAMSRGSADPETYFALGRALAAGRDCKHAMLYFGLGLRLDPVNADAIIQTAKCTAALESIDQGIAQLEDAAKKHAGIQAALLSAVAELSIQKGDWSRAEAAVNSAMEADPKAAAPWKQMALIHLNQESTDRKAVDKALQDYLSFSERNPSDVSGRMERYRLFTKRNEFDKASEELSQIYAVYPKYPNLHFYKGALYVLMGNIKVAVEEFRLELKNNPASVGTLIALGKVELDGGAPDQALEHFTQAMKLAPKSAEAKQWAGYASYVLKSFDAAIALYQAALQIDAANPMTYKRLGLAYRASGRNAEAAQAFRKYLEMEPDAVDRAEFERFL